jgi:hypothetical protein
MAIPFSSPDAAYSIAHGDVVDLESKKSEFARVRRSI